MEKLIIKNKKDVIPTSKKVGKALPPIVTIRVIKAHDGLAKGTEVRKPRAVAEMMVAKGYWKILK